jgi:hypothetical protein
MNKQKIVVRYELSDSAIKNYFLEGKKVEKQQSIEIETNNEKIIDMANLIDNESLEISYKTISDLRKAHVELRKYGNSSYWHNEEKYQESKEKERFVQAVVCRSYCGYDLFFPAKKILTAKGMLEILEYEKTDEYKELEKKRDEYQKVFDENLKAIEKEEAENIANREKAEKEREKQKSLRQSMIDDFVEKSGSETLKLRKELGYDYEGLAIQEKTDQIELQVYEKIVDSDDINSIENIKKPRLELMKLVKDVRQLDYVENADVQIWTKNLDYEYADYGEKPEKIEVLKVKYSIFFTDVTRYYIVG